jgi:hypothetical protein
MRSSTCLPSAPPDLLTRSSAILAPVTAYLPLSAPGPVTDATMPILIVSPPARAMGENADVAKPAASPMFTDRLVNLIHSSHGECAICAWSRRANWEPAISTQYCGIWTRVLANNPGSDMFLSRLLTADVARGVIQVTGRRRHAAQLLGLGRSALLCSS